MAGPGLPVNITAYPDDANDGTVALHQVHHDAIHAIVNAIDKDTLPSVPVFLAGVLANNQTGATYTLVSGDAGKVVEMNNGSANTLYVPTNASVAFPVGTCVEIWQQGAGQTSVIATTPGTTAIRAPSSRNKLSGQYASAVLRKRATDEWVLEGDTTT